MTVRETAAAWGCSRARVYQLLTAGMVPDARVIAGHWYIPDNIEKPAMGKRGRHVRDDKPALPEADEDPRVEGVK